MAKRKSLFGNGKPDPRLILLPIGALLVVYLIYILYTIIFFKAKPAPTPAPPPSTPAPTPSPTPAPGPGRPTQYKFAALLGSGQFYYSLIDGDYSNNGKLTFTAVKEVPTGNVKDLSINVNGEIVVVATDGSLWYSNDITSGVWVSIDPDANATNVSYTTFGTSLQIIYIINTSGQVFLYTKTNGVYSKQPPIPLPQDDASTAKNSTFTSISANPNDNSLIASTDLNQIWYMSAQKWIKKLDGGGGSVSSNSTIIFMLGTGGIYYYTRNGDTISTYKGPIAHPTDGVQWKSVNYILGTGGPTYGNSVVTTDNNNKFWYCKNIEQNPPVWQQYTTDKQGTKLMISHYYIR